MRAFGIFLLLAVGLFIAAQPWLGVYEEADPAFLSWVAGMGFVMMVHAVALFSLRERRRFTDRDRSAVALIFMLIYTFMVYRLFAAPDLVPVPEQREGELALMSDSEFKDAAVRLILGSVLAVQVLCILQYGKAVLLPRKE